MAAVRVVLPAGLGGGRDRGLSGRRTTPVWGALWVVLAVLAWLGATSGLRPLMLPDEGRYAGVAWEMLCSGDWATPTLAGMPFFHKPPLFYWLTAAALQLFGPQAWAARVASLLGAALAALSLAAFLRRWGAPQQARLALVVLLVQPLFYVGAQFANLDMLVAGCITATTALGAHTLLLGDRGLPAGRWFLAACALAAAGVLAKGLIGVVLPALVLLGWLAISRRLALLRGLPWAAGVALFVALALPWFALMEVRHPGFLHYFVVVQHLQRFGGAGFNNVQPAWFYPALLAVLSLPCLPWLVRLARHAWRDRRPPPARPTAARPVLHLVGATAAADPVADPSASPAITATPPSVRLLLLVWVAVVMGFFSLPASKLVGYVLPAVPPLAALMADGCLAGGPVGPRRRRAWAASLLLSAALGLAAIAVLVLRPLPTARPLAAALAARHQPGEPVFLLDGFPYDLPFLARLDPARTPVQVVADWPTDARALPDNWRKELHDAAGFAGPAARRHLLSPADWPAALCAAPVAWVVGPADAPARQPLLQGAVEVARGGDLRLWRVPAAGVSPGPCAGRPNADPAGR